MGGDRNIETPDACAECCYNEMVKRDETTIGAARNGSPDELELVVLLPNATQCVPLGGRWDRVVGRSGDAEIIVEHPTVSRRHARIRGGSSPTIEDLGSHNGTFIGGTRLAPGHPAPLTPDAAVAFGSVHAVVRPRTPREPTTGSRPSLSETLALVAPTDLPILIRGETGVGKEVLAREVQSRSRRHACAFVRINCAALTETLLESELFGYERGAFTGAASSKQGLLEVAHGGTAFLDEVGELSLAAQAKLLRVVETGEITRIGATHSNKIDVRYIAATHRDLASMIAQGTFREDLYFRLDGMTLSIPPLRERRADLERLAGEFIAASAAALGRPAPTMTSRARAALLAHPFRGNVRELKRLMDRVVLLCGGKTVDVEHLIGLSDGPVDAADQARTLLERSKADASRFEQQRIVEALAACGGNQTKAAELLGISRRTLVNRIHEFGLKRPRS